MQFYISPILISIKVAIFATVVTFFLGITVAYKMFNYSGKMKNMLDGLFTMPIVLPPTVLGYLLLLMLGRNGFIGKILSIFDISIIFTWYAAVIVATLVALRLMYKTTKSAFEQIDINIFEEVRTLGVSDWIIFWKIIIPLAWPGIIAGTVLTFMRILGEFGATLMVAGNIPGKTQTIPIAIFFATEVGEREKALILILLILVLSYSVIFVMNYLNNCVDKFKLTN